MSWREYWNGPHPIYVNERHRALHFSMIARDIARLIPSRDAVVLDYGCGEADSAIDVARNCDRLLLFDTAPNVTARLRGKFGEAGNIEVLDDSQLEALPGGSLDLVVINSVSQYLQPEELGDALDLLRPKLKPSGFVAIGDVIPQDDNAVADAKALLSFAWRGGFLTAAILGLVRTWFSEYRKMRDELGLTRYSQAEMLELLDRHGFNGIREPRNIGHNQGRMLFTARPQ